MGNSIDKIMFSMLHSFIMVIAVWQLAVTHEAAWFVAFIANLICLVLAQKIY